MPCRDLIFLSNCRTINISKDITKKWIQINIYTANTQRLQDSRVTFHDKTAFVLNN